MSEIRYFTNGEQATAEVLNRPLKDVDVQSKCMTEAEFNTLTEQRRQQYAGSGIIDWGRIDATGSYRSLMGTGHDMDGYRNMVIPAYNTDEWARYSEFGNIKQTKANVNGTQLNLSTSATCKWLYPEAPKGAKPASSDITDQERKDNFFFISDTLGSNAKYKAGDRVLHTNDMYECILDLVSGSEDLTDETYFTKLSSPILSRQDLVFLETWHELVQEKDIVYPYGNIQYLGGNTEGLSGLANGTFTGADTYSLFGNWQEAGDLIGKGYVWSNLSEEDKIKFVSNSENNVYLSKDGYVQVRYRVRVVDGLGNDWNAISPLTATNSRLMYDTVYQRVQPKGKVTNVPYDIGERGITTDYGTTSEFGTTNNGVTYFYDNNDKGIFGLHTGFNPESFGYNNNCYVLPIALVQRRNQGAYHSTFNNTGSGKYWVSDQNHQGHWYRDNVLCESIADTFDFSPKTTEGGTVGKPSGQFAGNISTGESGRPDGLYHDEINERDVEDLRMSAHKVADVQGYLYNQFNNAIKGQIRGKDKLQQLVAHYTCDTNSAGSGSGRYILVDNDSIDVIYSIYPLKENNTSVSDLNGGRKYTMVVTHPDVGTQHYKNIYAGNYYTGRAFFENIDIDVFANKSEVDIKIYGEADYTYNNHSLVCNIIGDVANYPSEWNENGIIGIPLLSGENRETYLEMSEEDGKGFGMSSSADAYNDYNNYSIKLPKKSYGVNLVLVYRNGTWTPYNQDNSLSHNSDDSQNTYGLDGRENRLAFHKNILESDNGLVVIFYQTHSDNTLPTSNKEVLAHGDVMVSNYSGTTGHGSLLASNLIGVVNTGGATTGQVSENKNLQNVTINSNQTFITTGWSTTNHPLSHNPVSIVKTSKRIAKFVPYLTKVNSTFKMVLLYKDVIWDDTNSNWGDNDQFAITNGPISYAHDDNGTLFTYGQKYINLPNFID